MKISSCASHQVKVASQALRLTLDSHLELLSKGARGLHDFAVLHDLNISTAYLCCTAQINLSTVLENPRGRRLSFLPKHLFLSTSHGSNRRDISPKESEARYRTPGTLTTKIM